jgi:hypothetical protein
MKEEYSGIHPAVFMQIISKTSVIEKTVNYKTSNIFSVQVQELSCCPTSFQATTLFYSEYIFLTLLMETYTDHSGRAV